MSSQGFDAVKTQNPDVLKLYNSKKGTGGPKAAFGDVQYMNEIIRNSSDLGIGSLTLYAFSTENWKRSEEEVGGIMKLLGKYLEEGLRDMEKNRVCFRFFGDLTKLSPELQKLCNDAVSRSADYDVQVNFCLNYGGRDEIVKATQAFAQDVAEGKRKPEDLTEDILSSYMYSANVPDPELIIRPSGEMRTSNFLLWQSAYSEYVFMDVLWPDFGAKELDAALEQFAGRNRRFGGV